MALLVININLKNLKPGKPSYERIKTNLTKLTCDVILTWEPENNAICPSSIAKYFYDHKYQVALCENKLKSHVIYGAKIPTILDENHQEFLEWLGIMTLEANLLDGTCDSFVSTYQTPEPYKEVGQLRVLQWRGLFTANQIVRLYNNLRLFLNENSCDWVALYCQGFSDSPIAWKEEEHHFYTNGDNSYTLVLTNQLISYQQKCSRKRYNNKRRNKPL